MHECAVRQVTAPFKAMCMCGAAPVAGLRAAGDRPLQGHVRRSGRPVDGGVPRAGEQQRGRQEGNGAQAAGEGRGREGRAGQAALPLRWWGPGAGCMVQGRPWERDEGHGPPPHCRRCCGADARDAKADRAWWRGCVGGQRMHACWRGFTTPHPLSACTPRPPRRAGGGGAQRKEVMAQFYGGHLRFFKQLCTASKVEEVERISKKALAEGGCVVIGLQSTGGWVAGGGGLAGMGGQRGRGTQAGGAGGKGGLAADACCRRLTGSRHWGSWRLCSQRQQLKPPSIRPAFCRAAIPSGEARTAAFVAANGGEVSGSGDHAQGG